MNPKTSNLILFSALAALAIGVVLSIYFNSLFIFIILPFGIGWSYSRRRHATSDEYSEREEEDADS